MKNTAFLFPGQGDQYVGMGKDFYDEFPIARETFEEADAILGTKLSSIIFEGPEVTLTETKNSQAAIYVTSIAVLRVLQKQFPMLKPDVCAGLSLGEYSALTATGKVSFAEGLPLVRARGQWMNDACEKTKGTMAAIIGLDGAVVEKMVKELNLPNDLWVANFNSPGQVVISGTVEGIAKGIEAAKARGAKRAIQLQVHGAFHSWLMRAAEERLLDKIDSTCFVETRVDLVMNVVGDYVQGLAEIRRNLIKQVTSSVRWEQGVQAMQARGVTLFVEMGCGATLAGLNKRIGVSAPTVSIAKVKDLDRLAAIVDQ